MCGVNVGASTRTQALQPRRLPARLGHPQRRNGLSRRCGTGVMQPLRHACWSGSRARSKLARDAAICTTHTHNGNVPRLARRGTGAGPSTLAREPAPHPP
eukprot:scaffold7971_cov457-Prasinococcus_capsulatus_cf.AAC.1